jgi:hypothetical protein
MPRYSLRRIVGATSVAPVTSASLGYMYRYIPPWTRAVVDDRQVVVVMP